MYLGGCVIFIGDLLIAHSLVTRADVTAALDLQRTKGGAIGACLVELGRISQVDLDAVVDAAPAPPNTIVETGLSVSDVLNLAMKAMYVNGEATPSLISEILKLAPSAIQQLLEEAEERRLVIVLGATNTRGVSELRYALSEKGTQWAQDAMRQNQYIGPAPVTLDTYRDRIGRQRIARERVDQAAIDEAFGDLVISKTWRGRSGRRSIPAAPSCSMGRPETARPQWVSASAASSGRSSTFLTALRSTGRLSRSSIRACTDP